MKTIIHCMPPWEFLNISIFSGKACQSHVQCQLPTCPTLPSTGQAGVTARTDGAVTCRHGDARNGIGWVLMLMRSWMWFGGGRVPAGRAPREALEHVRRVGPEQVPSGGPPRAHAPCFRGGARRVEAHRCSYMSAEDTNAARTRALGGAARIRPSRGDISAAQQEGDQNATAGRAFW